MNFHLTPSEPLPLKEADVVRQCTDYLRYRGWWVQRNPVGLYKAMSGGMAEFGPPGIPDYTAIHALYPAFFLEFKAPKKKLRTTQVIMFRHIQEQFGLTVVKIDNLEEMIEWLGKHEGRKADGASCAH